MEKLNLTQVARLHNHLVRTGTNDALIGELLDHLCCEVEYYMWIGLPFESAMDKALLEANNHALQHLHGTYKQELALTETQLEEASLDDIVFEFRNKAYGAYDLRQAYPHTLRNALIATVGLCMMLVALMQGISQRTWSYFSFWGALWLVGLGALTFAILSGYLHRARQPKLSIR